MASLKYKISEEINLDGVHYGSETEKSIGLINEYAKRIMTTNGVTLTTILSFDTSVAAGQYLDGDVRYIRITNLDSTNYVILRITGDASTDYSVRLDAGASHLIISTSSTGVVDYADITGVTLEDLSAISATANTAACDLEIVVASA